MESQSFNNIIQDRFDGLFTLSQRGDKQIKYYLSRGYKIINSWDFPKVGDNYPCYDVMGLMYNNLYIYQEIFFQVAFETYDNVEQCYKQIIRHFLIKTDCSIWVKQVVYKYKSSVLDPKVSESFRRSLCNLPDYNDFTLYYSGFWDMRYTPWYMPVNMVGCCFQKELLYFTSEYNNPKIASKQDLINGFYYLTSEDLTMIPDPPGNTQNKYNVNNAAYSKAAGYYQQIYKPVYVVSDEVIKNEQITHDNTQSMGSNPLTYDNHYGGGEIGDDHDLTDYDPNYGDHNIPDETFHPPHPHPPPVTQGESQGESHGETQGDGGVYDPYYSTSFGDPGSDQSINEIETYDPNTYTKYTPDPSYNDTQNNNFVESNEGREECETVIINNTYCIIC